MLDEPFSGLDALVRDQLIESVLDRASEATVFIASHDLAEIESFASHVGYIDQGRLKFTEEMSALLARFREMELTLETPRTDTCGLAGPLAQSGTGGCGGSVHGFSIRARANGGRDPAAVRGTRNIEARSAPLRSIFVALAKSSKQRD